MGGHNHTPAIQEHADAWHHHVLDEGLPQHEHTAVVNTGLLAKWVVLITVSLVITVVAIVMYFTSVVTQLKHQKVEREGWSTMSQGARRAKDEANARLAADGAAPTYVWTDAAAGTVQVPIEVGMQRVVERYKK